MARLPNPSLHPLATARFARCSERVNSNVDTVSPVNPMSDKVQRYRQQSYPLTN